MYTSWNLSIGMSPFMLNSLHMPLVYDDYNFLSITFIYLFEKVLVSLVDENALELWEKYICVLNEPVHLIRVKTLFSKLGWLRVVHSRSSFPSLHIPEAMTSILESLENILRQIHSRFVE